MDQPAERARLRLRNILLSGLLAIAGCADSSAPPSGIAPPTAAAAAPSSPSGASAQPAVSAAQGAALAERETWEILTIKGTRAGYGRTSLRYAEQAGRKVMRIEGSQHMAIQRFGEKTQQAMRFFSVETPDGKLLEFHDEIEQGATPLQTAGRVVGDRLALETTTQGKTLTSSLAWSPQYGGPFAEDYSLLRAPMKPGEHRALKALVPFFNVVATIELTAHDYEPTQLRGGSYDLLRIDSITRFPDGQTLPAVVWCDRTGDKLKTRMEAMDLESYRASEAEALEKSPPAAFDLGWNLSVRLEQAPPHGSDLHAAKRVAYRVHLQGGDPAAVFVSCPSQHVKSIDPHTAEVTVYALRPDQGGGNPAAANDPPTAADRDPNNLIQSDDATIVAMAKQAAGDATDPWQVALKLEKYVNHLITKKDFSQAFATAAEVARKPEGDCTEHAVLLAALCRARGIPARVAIGLVYMSHSQAFGYHMWNEVFLGQRWIPIDATLAHGGIGAGHLKLAHTSLQGASAYSSFLPVIQVAGRLQIAVLAVE